MNEIIEIQTNEENEQVVSARELHKSLESKKKFSDWWKQQVGNYIENQDYSAGHSEVTTNQYGGTKLMDDYMLTTDTAKEISLMSGTKKGREIRNYFIVAEKKLKQVMSQPTQQMSATDRSRLALESVVELDDRVTALEDNALLSSQDYDLIGKEVSRKVHSYRKAHNVDMSNRGKLFQDLNGQIKEITGAPSRGRIKQKDFDKVMEFIDMWEPKTSTKMAVK